MAVLGSVILIVGIVQFGQAGQFPWFFFLFVAAGLIVVGLSLWSALGRGPVFLTFHQDSSGPVRERHLRPGKTYAVVGVAMLVFGVVTFARAGNLSWLIVVWVAAGAAVIAFNLWAAFGKQGASYRITEEEGGAGPR
jgi:hypothetical protein